MPMRSRSWDDGTKEDSTPLTARVKTNRTQWSEEPEASIGHPRTVMTCERTLRTFSNIEHDYGRAVPYRSVDGERLTTAVFEGIGIAQLCRATRRSYKV